MILYFYFTTTVYKGLISICVPDQAIVTKTKVLWMEDLFLPFSKERKSL